MRSHNKKTKIWDQIYSFAKEGKIDELKKLIAAGNCIGVFKGEYTPIMVLAKEGNLEAVKLLIQKFNANAGEALYGAMLRHRSEIIKFLTTQRNLNKDYYLLAYGQLGNEEGINRWLDLGYDINFAVKGAGRGGHMRLVHKLIKQGANPVEAITGLVLGGFVKEAEKLTVEYGEPFCHIAKALAIQGKTKAVNNLLKIHGNERECVYFTLYGYSFGGFQQQADALHNTKKRNRTNEYKIDCWKYRLQGHAEGGQNIISYFKLLDEDLRIINDTREKQQESKTGLIHDNICYYRHGGHHDAVNYLLNDETMADFIGLDIDFKKTLSSIKEFSKTFKSQSLTFEDEALLEDLIYSPLVDLLFYYKASVKKINEITNLRIFLHLEKRDREFFYQKILHNFVEMHHPMNQKNLFNFLFFLDNDELRSYVINSYDNWNKTLDLEFKDQNFDKMAFIKKLEFERYNYKYKTTQLFLLSLKNAKTRIEEIPDEKEAIPEKKEKLETKTIPEKKEKPETRQKEISDEKEKLDMKESGSGFKPK